MTCKINKKPLMLSLSIVLLSMIAIPLIISEADGLEAKSMSFGEEIPTQEQIEISTQLDSLIEKYNKVESQRRALVVDLRAIDSDDKDNRKEILNLEIKIKMKKSRMDLILKQVDYLAPLEQNYESSVGIGINPQVITQGDTIFAGSNHQACDSSSISSSSNQNTGTINTNSDTISWIWNVADAKSVGWFYPFCSNVTFEEMSIMTRNNSQSENCTNVMDNVSSGDLIQTCNCGIETNDLLSWYVSTTYEPNNEGNDDWYGLHRVS